MAERVITGRTKARGSVKMVVPVLLIGGDTGNRWKSKEKYRMRRKPRKKGGMA